MAKICVQRKEIMEYLTMKDVASSLETPLRTIYHYRAVDPTFPTVYRFGQRRMHVERDEFEVWKASKKLT